MKTRVSINHFYPEEFRKKGDAEKYHSKGTCEVDLLIGSVEMSLKNIRKCNITLPSESLLHQLPPWPLSLTEVTFLLWRMVTLSFWAYKQNFLLN